MNRKEYWQWIEDIWRKPEDTTRRLAFADWLQENNCEPAAIRQRAAAKLISRCYVIYSIVLSQYGGKSHEPRMTVKVFGLITTKNKDMVIELKPDSRVVVELYTNHGHTQKHVLCGSFQGTIPEMKLRDKRQLKKAKFRNQQLMKERQHGSAEPFLSQGHITGRWSGRTWNPSNIPRSQTTNEGSGNNGSVGYRVHGQGGNSPRERLIALGELLRATEGEPGLTEQERNSARLQEYVRRIGEPGMMLERPASRETLPPPEWMTTAEMNTLREARAGNPCAELSLEQNMPRPTSDAEARAEQEFYNEAMGVPHQGESRIHRPRRSAEIHFVDISELPDEQIYENLRNKQEIMNGIVTGLTETQEQILQVAREVSFIPPPADTGKAIVERYPLPNGSLTPKFVKEAREAMQVMIENQQAKLDIGTLDYRTIRPNGDVILNEAKTAKGVFDETVIPGSNESDPPEGR